MRYETLDPKLFIRNRQKLVRKLKPGSLIIVNSHDEMPRNGDQDFPFRQQSDLFYLSGLDQEKTILTICPNHPDPRFREIAFVKKTNRKMITWYGHKYTKAQARQVSGIKTILWQDEFRKILPKLVRVAKQVYLNKIENPKYKTEVPYLDLRFEKEFHQKFPRAKVKRLAPIMAELRVIKEPEEIALIQKACDITHRGFLKAAKYLKPGVMEYEIEAEIAREFIRDRAGSHAFLPIIAGGANNCVFHYFKNDQPCQKGDLLVIDFGSEYANYASDVTRVLPIGGKFTRRQRQIYQAVLRTSLYAQSIFKPGISINESHKKVQKFIEKEMIKLGLLTTKEVAKQDSQKPKILKYFPHKTSHYIGLDAHDPGDYDWPMAPGMVISCEPGIYIPEENVGIRLEDDILITDEGCLNLTRKIPIDPDEIEKLVSR